MLGRLSSSFTIIKNTPRPIVHHSAIDENVHLFLSLVTCISICYGRSQNNLQYCLVQINAWKSIVGIYDINWKREVVVRGTKQMGVICTTRWQRLPYSDSPYFLRIFGLKKGIHCAYHTVFWLADRMTAFYSAVSLSNFFFRTNPVTLQLRLCLTAMPHKTFRRAG